MKTRIKLVEYEDGKIEYHCQIYNQKWWMELFFLNVSIFCLGLVLLMKFLCFWVPNFINTNLPITSIVSLTIIYMVFLLFRLRSKKEEKSYRPMITGTSVFDHKGLKDAIFFSQKEAQDFIDKENESLTKAEKELRGKQIKSIQFIKYP
jgi:hypothetical protein